MKTYLAENYDSLTHFINTGIDSVKPLAVSTLSSNLAQLDHLLQTILFIVSVSYTFYKFYTEYQVHKNLINSKKQKKDDR